MVQVLSSILHSELFTVLIRFFDSNFFVAIVGLGIFLLYRIQQGDHKRAAANTIFYELRSAEKTLRIIKDTLDQEPSFLLENIYPMQTESWSKYKYQFIKDFDRDEWDTITDFYNKCALIDEAIRYNKTFFQKNEEQIRANKYRIFADYTKEFIDSPGNAEEKINDFFQRTKIFDDAFMQRQYIADYKPMKPINDAKQHIKDLNLNISFSVIGQKLKKLARIRL